MSLDDWDHFQLGVLAQRIQEELPNSPNAKALTTSIRTVDGILQHCRLLMEWHARQMERIGKLFTALEEKRADYGGKCLDCGFDKPGFHFDNCIIGTVKFENDRVPTGNP